MKAGWKTSEFWITLAPKGLPLLAVPGATSTPHYTSLPPAPQPRPESIVLGPQRQIPLGGLPRQDIPLAGPPRQDTPLGGPPKQDIPLGTPPKQDLPLGTPPRQQIPLGPEAQPIPKAGT